MQLKKTTRPPNKNDNKVLKYRKVKNYYLEISNNKKNSREFEFEKNYINSPPKRNKSKKHRESVL